ncbi:hypothetical protein N9L68_00170 [bacterium]|nr:hypothetical protein [bacterium]
MGTPWEPHVDVVCGAEMLQEARSWAPLRGFRNAFTIMRVSPGLSGAGGGRRRLAASNRADVTNTSLARYDGFAQRQRWFSKWDAAHPPRKSGRVQKLSISHDSKRPRQLRASGSSTADAATPMRLRVRRPAALVRSR